MLAAEDGQSADMDAVLLNVSFRHSAAVIPQVPAKLGLDSRNQFKWVERLGDIIIRADSQPGNLIDILDPCRQHDNREKMLLAYLAAKGKSVGIRQHDIQHRKTDFFPFHTGECVGSVVTDQNGEAFIFQVDTDQFRNFLFVVDDQYIFFHPSSSHSVSGKG